MDDVLEEDMKVNLDNKIKPIDISTVHRICSGQVVLTLATAVKELVENSLDAGSTSIEIRLKNYGADCIEVIDNGSGIEECNFQALTLKHYTSKLKDFTDLVDVSTFGFRGEALSSLCALSTLSVVTCHHLASTGSRLQFDHNGNLVSTTPYPRQVGTTVLVEQLFSTLPVRHKEFQRNLKKEFAKMVQTLTSYCLISLGVKINCSNQITNRRVTVLNVSGNKSVRENIIDIFGAKQLKSLMELRQCEPTETLCPEFDLTKIPATNRPAIGLSGYVSSAIHGEGRGAADQQYYFINGRPCDPTKVVRLVNDVYHSYNRHQYPFVVLSVQLDSGYADVNVTPDKRQILVLSETLLLATVKASLVEMYQSTVGICPGIAASSMTEEPLSRPVQNRSAMVSGENSPPVTLANLKRTFGSAFAKTTPISKPKQGKLDSFVRECRRDSISTVDSTTTVAGAAANSRSPSSTNLPERNLCESEDPLLDVDASGRADEDPLSGSSTAADGSFLVLTGSSDVTNGDVEDIRRDDGEQFCSVESDSSCLEDDIGPLARVERNEPVSTHLHSKLSKFASLRSRASSSCAISGSGKKLNKRSNRTLVGNVIADDPVSIGQSSPEYGTKGVGQPTSDLSDIDDDVRCQDAADSTDSLPAGDTVGDDVSIDSAVPVVRRSFLLPFSMSRLKETLQCRHLVDTNEGTRHRTFLAKISPSDNHVAESELRKELKKDMFERMEIIGQFNLGFIITRLGRDLFIIDQHATDEKYNFETLQRNTVIKGQKLIQPVPMQLTAVNESILIDNIEVFRKNGFDFVTDTDDIEEMIFMLSDSPGVLCRPSRIRAMFASRACRSSVMIGTALNKGEMKKVCMPTCQLMIRVERSTEEATNVLRLCTDYNVCLNGVPSRSLERLVKG